MDIALRADIHTRSTVAAAIWPGQYVGAYESQYSFNSIIF